MGAEVAGACFHWSQSLRPHNPSSAAQTVGSAISSLSSRRRRINGCDRALTYHILHQQTDHRRSPFLGTTSGKISRTRSLEENQKGGRRNRGQALRRASSASLGSFDDDDDEDDEEFLSRLQELAMRIHQESSNDLEFLPESRNRYDAESSGRTQDASCSAFYFSSVPSPMSPLPLSRKLHEPSADPPWPAIRPERPDWPDLVPASVERKANSVDLPLSLRIIKRRKRLEEGFREAGESACCSMKRAFSSMVFIIREIQSYTLQMREILFYENIQGILARVQGEMHASFVWLFEHIFSCTPTLMVYLMLLLANFTVYSMGHASGIAAASPNPPLHSVVTVSENHYPKQQNFDPSSIMTFSLGGRTSSVGGGGGGKVRPVAGPTDDGRPDGPSSSYHGRTVFPEGFSTAPAPSTEEEEGVGGEGAALVTEEDEARLWNSIVEEASRMQAMWRDEALMDPETLQRFVSPVTVEIEAEDQSSYLQTEVMYQQALSQDPDNTLLLCNFAQFLYVVLHDLDRAEYYFKRAVGMKPVDGESLSRYATFLWLARKDLGAAEETYLEAIAVEPSNTYHASNYAHFLWNTGGEDTCYPLDGGDVY